MGTVLLGDTWGDTWRGHLGRDTWGTPGGDTCRNTWEDTWGGTSGVDTRRGHLGDTWRDAWRGHQEGTLGGHQEETPVGHLGVIWSGHQEGTLGGHLEGTPGGDTWGEHLGGNGQTWISLGMGKPPLCLCHVVGSLLKLSP